MNKAFSTLMGASVLATGLMAFAPSQAQAAACTTGGITETTSGFSLIGSPLCYGALTGNDSASLLNTGAAGTNPIPATGAWGSNNWSFLAKQDTPGGQSGTGNLLINGSTNARAGITGTWGYDNFIAGMRYALVVKGADNWSVYGFVANATTGGGIWDNNLAGLRTRNGRNVPALSHFTIYKDSSSTAPIPEPITLLGSGIALGFGTYMKRKLDKAKVKG